MWEHELLENKIETDLCCNEERFYCYVREWFPDRIRTSFRFHLSYMDNPMSEGPLFMEEEQVIRHRVAFPYDNITLSYSVGGIRNIILTCLSSAMDAGKGDGLLPLPMGNKYVLGSHGDKVITQRRYMLHFRKGVYGKAEWHLDPFVVTCLPDDVFVNIAHHTPQCWIEQEQSMAEEPNGTDLAWQNFVDSGCRQSALRVLHLLRLLGCKNIRQELVEPPERVNKKRRRSGKQEMLSYHVLKVKPTMTRKSRSERTQSVPLSHQRLHFQRGHFKEFTEDGRLFGRHTGTFWWQPHVQGQNRKGIVLKDYEVVL